MVELKFSFFIKGSMKDVITTSLYSSELKYFEKDIMDGKASVDVTYGKTDEVMITITDKKITESFLDSMKSIGFRLSLKVLRSVGVMTKLTIDGRSI
jgi:hypothetical protein